MIQINDSSFEIVYKRDAMKGDKKYAGGVIFANSNQDALMIAVHMYNDIQKMIDKEEEAKVKEENNKDDI